MQIIKNDKENLNATITITVSPEDYAPKVDSTIKKHQKTFSLPGFRPGKVPKSVIQKMYGEGILFEELNKMVGEKLDNYLKENKIDILGSPMPEAKEEFKIDWKQPADYSFNFEIGLAPSFELKLPPKNKFTEYAIEVDKERIEKYSLDLRKRYGKVSQPDVTTDESIITAHIEELNKNGEAFEGGVHVHGSLVMDIMKDKNEKKKLVGLKIGDEVEINIAKAFDDDYELNRVLKVDESKLATISKRFKIRVEEINHVEAAPLEKAFFDKVFGSKKIENKTEYETVLKEELEKLYASETKRFLQYQFEEYLLKELKLTLPDAFLKKWMASNTKKPIEQEKLEEHYDDYARGIKWQLIENKIFQEQKMELKDEEMKEMALETIKGQLMQYGQASLPDETMNSLVENYLSNQDSLRQIIESLASRKVNDYIHSVISKETKKVNYDKFVKIIEKEKSKK